jgi:negative regulator of sigma E activity
MSIRISLLLDGQLESTQVREVLREVGSDPAQRDRYTIYGLIGDALRGNSTPDDGYTIRILERMRDERAQMEEGFDPLEG